MIKLFTRFRRKRTPMLRQWKRRETLLHTYQVKYVEDDVEYTKLMEATHVIIDDEKVEVWDDNILLLYANREDVMSIRNVSVLDMMP